MPVNVSVHGTTTVVEIDRPERRNALDGPTLGGIGAAFAAAEADDAIRAVVLTGAGADAFCAGADLRATGADRSPPAGSPSIDVFTTRCYPKPVIAAVNGAAVGGGFELVLAADLVVAAEHATFSVPEVKRGLVGGQHQLEAPADRGAVHGGDHRLRVAARREHVDARAACRW